MKNLFGFDIQENDQTVLQQDRTSNYDKNWCYQYDMRIKLLQEDLFYLGMSQEDVAKIRVEDFIFKNVTSIEDHKKCKSFIERYEWLGTVPSFTSHWFMAYYKDIVAGVVLIGEPYSYTRLLGDDTQKYERLISRGACISWSPKNLASSFVMWCIKWMVQNTQYRLFVAYSDPSAKELGTIYQACNFYYLGQNFGKVKKYRNPYNDKICSCRTFRTNNMYKKYAEDLGIEWDDNWIIGNIIHWDKVPDEIEKQLRAYCSKMLKENLCFTVDQHKHKYAYVLGIDKRETKALRKIVENNIDIDFFDYPKERGK